MKDIVMLKRLLTIITLLLMALPAYAQQAGNLQSRNNLSDVVSNSSAITNLGLGIAVQCAGVVGDATLINNAITAANANATGGLVQLLAGKCYINEQAGERILPMSNVTLKGMGRGVTTIQCNDVTGGTDCIANEPSNNVFTPITNFTMKDFTILGYALTNPTSGGQLIRIGSVTDILIDNVESDYSRNMGMVISGNRVVVTNSRIFRSTADGIAVWDASDAVISNNVINGANDDAISAHSDDSAAAPVRSGVVITQNTISESQGISALGPKILTISNNVMRRMETYCISAGYGGSPQGDTTPIGISITGNTCTDVFARNDQPNPRNMSGVYINVIGGVRLIPSGYSAPPGEPAATSGTVTPLLGTGVGAFFTNSVNTTGIGNSSAYAIDISHNILLRTLPAPTTISSWGDPTLSSGLWVANNGSAGNPFYNGAISETYFHNSGIQLNAAMRHMRISDNTIKTGGAYGIRFDTYTQSVNGDYDDVNITNNSISDFTTSGVGGFSQTAVSHQVYVTDNVFDGDPEFKSALRGPHGTWLYDYWPIGVDITNITGFTVEGNKFKNLDDTVVAGSGNNRIARNTVYAMPYTVGFNNANQGVGNIPAGPDWTTVAQVSDPTASNYGVTITAPLSASTAMPTTGTFVAGTFISNSSLGNSPTTVIGWSRVTTGSNNVLGTDWIAIYSWFAVSGSGATANITSPTNTTGALNYWNGGTLTWSVSTYGGSGNNFSIWDQAGSRAVFSANPSGSVYIGGGTAAASTAGAAVNIMGQSGGTGNQNGGNVVITPGAATGSGATGTINLLGTTNVTGNLNVTGTGYVTTASAGTNTTQIATTGFDTAAVGVETARATAAEALKAPLASPTFTGSTTIPAGTISANVSASTVLATGSTTARTLAARAADRINIRDYAAATTNGKIGGASHGYTSTAFTSGATSITLIPAQNVASIGQYVIGSGAASGATVISVSLSGGVETVGLSAGLTANEAANTRFDFYTQDDLPAFQAAGTAAANAGGSQTIYIPADGYYLSGYAWSGPNATWVGDNFSFNIQGGVADSIDQSQAAEPMGHYQTIEMNSPGTQNASYIAANNNNSNSPSGYEHIALSLELKQSATSSYTFRGQSSTTVRDLVGLSTQGNCSSGNVTCSLFGAETLLNFAAGTDGPAVGVEYSIANNTGVSNTELGSWDNKTAATYLAFGSTVSPAAQWIAGGGWQNGTVYETTIQNKAWAVRTEGSRNGSGMATSHQDYAYASIAGELYGQSAHIVSGATSTDVDAIGGVTIQGSTYGQIDIGDARVAAGPTPRINFHLPSGAGSDSADVYFTDQGGNLAAIDASANEFFFASNASGIIGTQLGAKNTSGVVISAGGSRGVGEFDVQLTGSGFDMIQETGTQGIYIVTTGGYNAQFNSNGTTTFNYAVTAPSIALTPYTSSSIGGSALGAGACASTTVSITGLTTAMVVNATPATYPGDSAYWKAYASAAGTATVKVCEAIAGTPTASTYNIRVIQ